MRNILTIISGGQTGVDQAALRAAKACGYKTGGWAPKGWHTEDGPARWLAGYGVREAVSSNYPERTRRNVEESNALIWLGDPDSPGGKLTLSLAADRLPPVDGDVYPDLDCPELAADVAASVRRLLPRGGKLLVAGSRESRSPGIGLKAEAALKAALRLLAEDAR